MKLRSDSHKITQVFDPETGIAMDIKINMFMTNMLPSGELTFCHGTSPFLRGKSTISMAMFNSFLYVHQRLINEAGQVQVASARSYRSSKEELEGKSLFSKSTKSTILMGMGQNPGTVP